MNRQLLNPARALAAIIAGFLLFAGIWGASPAKAEEQVFTEFSVSGVLLNNDVPLEGVAVRVDGPDGFTYEALSDVDGNWEIFVPAEDVYTVTLDVSTLPEGVKLTSDADAVQQVDLVGLGFAGVGFSFGAGSSEEQSFAEQISIRLFSGLNFGLLLAISAIGISLIYGATGLNNFAHGEMVTMGALFMWLFYSVIQMNIFVAGLLTVALVAASGFAQNQFLWKPLRKRRLGLNQIMIVSIGFSIVARYIFLIFFDGDTKDISGGGNLVTLGPIITTDLMILSMILCTISLAGVAYFLTRTRIGKATRAVSDNSSLAASSGIDVDVIIRTIWIMAGALTGLAGVLYGLQFQANWELGFNILLLLFAAVTLGGLGTAMGATVGALIIGVIVEVSPLFIADELKYAIALVILIFVLVFRPQGVLGKKQRIG